MRFKDITSITGISGLFKMESQKPSGVIVTSLTEGWTKFVSSREHLFSPLENISIYTSNDTVDLLEVMLKAYEQKETNPPVDAKGSNDSLKAYFEKVLPDFDQEKVHMSDIKKFVKWFAILDEKGILQTEADEKLKSEKEEKENSEKALTETETEEKTTEKKVAKKTKKAETAETEESTDAKAEVKPKAKKKKTKEE